MAAFDKVKVVVVGDSGVGKSSLVHLICQNEPIANPSWTIGCSVEVKLHDYKEGTPAQKTYFVELWDIGGSSSHSNTRAFFYNSIHGVILVHDLTNRKSQLNLRKWLSELFCRDAGSKKGPGYVFKPFQVEYDAEQFGDRQLPILVVGTKLDLAHQVLSPSRATRSSSFSDECGADEFFVDCHQVKSLAPGSTNAVKLCRFFDKVIEKRYPSHSGTMSVLLEKKRLGPPMNQGLPRNSGHVQSEKLLHWE